METSEIQSVGYERSVGLGTGSQPSVQCKGVSSHVAGTQHVHTRARNRRGVEIVPDRERAGAVIDPFTTGFSRDIER